MSIASKLLPAIALAIALSPVAVQAQTAKQSAHAQHYNHVDDVMAGSSTIDRPSHFYTYTNVNTFPGGARA
jgi:hypothetical protein